jgi:uncharacterized membrane protein
MTKETMLTLRFQALVGVVLGVFSIVALAISHLALTDIAHGESNPSQEWFVLQLSAIVFLLFIVVSLATFVRLLRTKA